MIKQYFNKNATNILTKNGREQEIALISKAKYSWKYTKNVLLQTKSFANLLPLISFWQASGAILSITHHLP